MTNQTLIGKIKNINGNIISIHLDDNIKSNSIIINGKLYRIGQIGSFIKIPLGYAHLFGIITQIGADAIPERLKDIEIVDGKDLKFSTRWMTAVLIGERIGNRFERGVLQFPTVEDDVHLVTLDDLNIIYLDKETSNSFTIGNVSVSESLPAKIDINKFLTRHCALVGSTGSGKSNAVAIILEAIAKSDFKSARVLLIDPHGEYNETLANHSKVFKINSVNSKNEEELCIPYWALPLNELLNLFPGTVNDKQKDYLREKILNKRLNAIDLLNFRYQKRFSNL